MSKEEAKALYEGKTFYIKNPDGSLDGPREDLYYCVPSSDKKGDPKTEKYKFVQVIDGKPRQAFLEGEIVVMKNGKQVA